MHYAFFLMFNFLNQMLIFELMHGIIYGNDIQHNINEFNELIKDELIYSRSCPQ